MKQRTTRACAVVLVCTLLSSNVRAQDADAIVYDPWNWYQAVLEVYYFIQEIQVLIWQAQRIPVNMASRYRGQSINWVLQDLTSALTDVRPLLSALNTGDGTGGAYRGLVDPLDVPTDIVTRMPPELRRRFAAIYATIELADHVATRAIDQVGSARATNPGTRQTLLNLETDAVAPIDSYSTQTALLNKINGTSVLGLRLADQTNQFLLNTVEQLIVDNTRKRGAEAALMDATIYQWRYGPAYGADLFRNTATNLDTWRMP
jgi:hypothetical protein